MAFVHSSRIERRYFGYALVELSFAVFVCSLLPLLLHTWYCGKHEACPLLHVAVDFVRCHLVRGDVLSCLFWCRAVDCDGPRLLEDFVSGPLDYFNSTAERVLDFASDWSTGERKPLDAIPLDLSDFTTVHEQAMGFIALARRYYFDYLDKVSIATFCVSSVGLVLIILILPFACCHCCIPCFPLILSCLYWVTGVLFAVLGTVVSVLAYATTVGCGELELQYTRQPGVFQWYAVPYCQRQFNFSNINKMIREKELELSREACNQLLGVCESVTPGETAAEPMKLLAAGVIPSAIPGVIPAAFPAVPGVAVPGSVPAAVTGVPGAVFRRCSSCCSRRSSRRCSRCSWSCSRRCSRSCSWYCYW
ncbi:hypothetical protein TcBrA4_0069940 [Trypanosoma cruzi]|nr:hypothetical protein TcBrA4_0069940 [Trypanosoma cruzi]